MKYEDLIASFLLPLTFLVCSKLLICFCFASGGPLMNVIGVSSFMGHLKKC